MSRRYERVLIVAIGGASLIGLPCAATTDSTSDDTLRREISHLESRIAELESQRGDTWLSESRASEIRAIVKDVINDADTRSSLLQGGASAGWDDGFFFASSDNNFRLNVSGQMQFRYVFNKQDDSPGLDSSRGGFENRRTKLIFMGHVVDPSWVYRIEGNFNFAGGGFGLQDAYIGKAFDGGWTVLAGQLKVPLYREWLIDSTMQQFVERSLISAEFDAGRTQGVAADYRNDWLHFTAAFADGHPATGGFNAPALAPDTEYSFTARAEVLFAGGWGQFNDFASWKGEDFAFMLGGGIHFQDGEWGLAGGEVEVFQWTVDGSLEFGGGNLFASVVGRHTDFSAGGDFDQYGVVLQGGFFLTDDWELFARFEWGDDDIAPDDYIAITGGATKYFAGHQLKWTTDLGVATDTVPGTFGTGFLGIGGGQAGWRTDGPGNDSQVVFRTQFQLLF